MKKDKHHQHITKPLGFIILSVCSTASLFGAFAGDLQPYTVITRSNQGLLGGSVITITRNHEIPKGSKLVEARHDDDLIQKSILLAIAAIGSASSLVISAIDFNELELQHATTEIEFQSRKQLQLEAIKNRYAIMSIAQREQFRLELSGLLELTGGDDTLEASEINATDKFINCSYLIAEGHSLEQSVSQTWQVAIGTPDHEAKKQEYIKWSSGKA